MKKTLVYFFVFCFLFSCKNVDLLVLSIDNSNLELTNGIMFYKENRFTGIILRDIEVDEIAVTTSYLNGKKHGKEFKKYTNDSLAEVRFYTMGNKSGMHRGWWPNRNKKFEFNFNELGEYNGIVREWYSNGQIFKDFNYIKGKENGSQKMWQKDGKIRANYIVKNGERYGLIGLKKCYTVTTDSTNLK